MKERLLKMKFIEDCRLKIENSRSGQVAIIVLLVSAVLMTVGLSLSKKATTETKIDTNEELLKKAFNAAESGIDYYLGTGSSGSGSYIAPDNLSSADVMVNSIGGGAATVLDFGEFVPMGGAEFYWLVNHNSDGSLGSTYYASPTIQVCGIGFTGSAEVNYFYKSGTSYGIKRYGYNFGTAVVNGFASASGCGTINIVSSPILVTVMPIFGGGRFYVQGGAFPVQGEEISSTGTATFVNKRLRVLRRYKIPSFMLTGVVSEISVLSE